MWKLKKIFETVLTFIIIMLLICFGISLMQVFKGNISSSEVISKTGLYFLYTIGYGALEGDAILQNILAMIGIVSLALMSTFLTINLFWRMDDVKLLKKVMYNKDYLSFTFQNKGRTICDVKANFALYNTETSETSAQESEYAIPMLINKASWQINADLNQTFWYQVLYQLLTQNNVSLYCIYSFVDTKSGQSSIKVETFSKDNIYLKEEKLTLGEFIKPIILPISDLQPIASGGKITLNETKLTYHFTNKKENNFVMAYYNFHQFPLNLAKYNQENTYLSCNFNSQTKAIITLEIKNANGLLYQKKVTISKETNVKIKLSEIDGSKENITEICYTIFSIDNPLKGEIILNNLNIIIS